MVLQAWLDDSGKDALQSPVYLLAGYCMEVSKWAPFVDDWTEELNRTPKLEYLHTYDAYSWENEFGKDKRTGKDLDWLKYWGPHNRKARDERLLAFAHLIEKYKPQRFRFVLSHREYNELSAALAKHPHITAPEIRAIKNPYYQAFRLVLGKMLKRQENSGESIHILFDEDIDRKQRLEDGF